MIEKYDEYYTSININGICHLSSNCEKILGISIDTDFTFDEQIIITFIS